ncbi:hypothetical protein [Nostoc sp. UHCC 0251]|uniref:hypothetical protein n=1 Tax=Nostoc sp. UHCC 0251 TaxID=3110240 RepID=UPI002B1EA1C7|nr:hypothetical protein [Nostoc sp. UHCC 0251]MEA5621837.1 hypothetical protein [Nostoc sp. UHCC 0251]
MTKRTKYYSELIADYSKPELVANELAVELLRDAEIYISQRHDVLPEVTSEYSLEQVEQENKHWWPTHCEALRQGRGDISAGEYANSIVYLCADGYFYGKIAATNKQVNRWAILAQPSITIVWPIVMFNGEVVYCEWNCFDDETNQVIAKGNETLLRRGHRGACYLKCEQLSFYRDVYTSDQLLYWLRR